MDYTNYMYRYLCPKTFELIQKNNQLVTQYSGSDYGKLLERTTNDFHKIHFEINIKNILIWCMTFIADEIITPISYNYLKLFAFTIYLSHGGKSVIFNIYNYNETYGNLNFYVTLPKYYWGFRYSTYYDERL